MHASWQTVHWDGKTIGSWTEYLEGADVCINLAGRSVNCRYTAENRAAILQLAHQHNAPPRDCHLGLADPPGSGSTPPRPPSTGMRSIGPWMRSPAKLGGNELIGNHRRAPDTWNFSPGGERLGSSVFRRAHAANAQGGSAQRDHHEPRRPAAHSRCCSIWCGSVWGEPRATGSQFVSWIHELDFARAVEFLIARE